MMSPLEARQVLTFELRGECWGVPLPRVREILEYAEPTRVPSTPRYVLGVLDLRERVVPVVDLAARIGRGDSGRKRRSCIVVLEAEVEGRAAPFGVLVDAVRDLLELGEAEAIAREKEEGGERSECCWHELDRPDGALLLLDVDAVLRGG